MTEAELQKAVIDEAHWHKWLVVHFGRARTRSGWATPVVGDSRGFVDLILVRERLVFVELKKKGSYPRPEQRAWHEALRQAGQEVYVWRPKDWINGTITSVLRRSDTPSPSTSTASSTAT